MNGVIIISVGPYPPVSDKETQTKEQLLLSTKRAVGPQDVCLRIEDRTHSQQLRKALGCHEGDTYRQVELMQSLKYYEKDSKVCVCEGGTNLRNATSFPCIRSLLALGQTSVLRISLGMHLLHPPQVLVSEGILRASLSFSDSISFCTGTWGLTRCRGHLCGAVSKEGSLTPPLQKSLCWLRNESRGCETAPG